MSEHQNSFTGAVCQHVRLNSEPCTQPARRNSAFCRFHDAAMKPLPVAHNLNDQLPVLEDPDAIQIAIMRLLRFLMKGPIDRKDISTLLYGLQLASTNLARSPSAVRTGARSLRSQGPELRCPSRQRMRVEWMRVCRPIRLLLAKGRGETMRRAPHSAADARPTMRDRTSR